MIIALIALIVLSPIFILLTIVLWIGDQSTPFFTQVRIGKDLKPFMVVKFKTMRSAYDIHGNLLPDDKRKTFLGNIIRQTSLDEIPQLFNVISGEMSLVGPRPLLAEYVPLYAPNQIRRHNVLPGLTGLAQVNGRNTISWSKKFEYDVWYVDHLNFALDFKIMMNSFITIMKANGIEQVSGKFDGSN